MNAEEFAAIKKDTDEQMAAFDAESQKLHDELTKVQDGLVDLTARRTASKQRFRAATVAFQMTRMGISMPNVVNVPTATVKVKGN